MEMFMVWVAGEFAGEFATEDEARSHAQSVARSRGRDAIVHRYANDDDNEGVKVFSTTEVM